MKATDVSPQLKQRVGNHALVLYDGECGFCQYWVRFVIRHDARSHFLFAPLQAEWTKSLQDPSQSRDLDSIVLYENGVVFRKSEAAFLIAGKLDFPWKIAKLFRLLPGSLTDFFYDLVAKRRHRLSLVCEIPTPEERARFIE